jgi:hypothetical protein
MDVFPNLFYFLAIGVLVSPCEGEVDPSTIVPGSGMLILCSSVYYNELYTIL